MTHAPDENPTHHNIPNHHDITYSTTEHSVTGPDVPERNTHNPRDDIAAAYRTLAGAADMRTTSHILLTSLPMWISWVEANWCVNLDGWWQHPALVIELDTAWRTWRNAWGPSGTDQAKASWLYDWSVTLGRIVETPKTYMKMLTSSQFTPVFFTDAPNGTLGIVPDFPLQEVATLDGLTGEIIEPAHSDNGER